MSAIYGLVDLSGNAVNNEINDRIHKGYSHCLIDRYKHLVHDNAAFGTEIQILNVEDEVSKWDTPLYDEVKDIKDEILKKMYIDKVGQEVRYSSKRSVFLCNL